MKRRTAILFFGFLTLAILGYVAWCGRSFYLRPGLAFDTAVPEDARKDLTSWYVTQEHFKAEPFTWQRLLVHLRNPWGKHRIPDVMVKAVEDGRGATVYAEHFYRPFRCLEFGKGSAGWIPFGERNVMEMDMREMNYRSAKEREKQIYDFNRMPNMPEKLVPRS